MSDVLAEVFKRGGMKRGVRRAEAVLLWPQVAGLDVAKFAQAKSLKDGTLFVEVTDSETAMHLSFQREKFLNVYRGKFGVKDVREIRFRVGSARKKEAREPPEPHAHAPIDARALSSLAKHLGELELPDHLSQPAMKAAKAMLALRARREAEGWRPCPICDAMSEKGGACESCRRYAAMPKVQRASTTLATNPGAATPLLSEEERAVAVHLASDYLREKLQELLPQVLADPSLKTQLETLAQCYLAHTLGKTRDQLSEEDYAQLEPRIARALGRWR